jgi:asparagine synthase (glutamine-hydrolysing)
MCNIIAHRGPDDEGYYIEDYVALGVRRLSIIDLETGGQPIHNEDKTLWLVFNGEVFNFIELRARLESGGHRFHTKSDTEVIVHLYEEMGERCVEELNGMFAFALWDANRHKLILARDRIGVKPLYYHLKDGKLIFGSEIKALLAAGVEVSPDRRAILDYMTLSYVLGDKTFFEDIRQLMPGHYAVFQDGKFVATQYWDLSYKATEREEIDTVRMLRPLLEDAVRIRLRSDVPLGCHLSGGIDSSSVTCIASRLLGRQVKTFTGAFNEGPEYDETYYAKLVSKKAGTEYFEVRPDGNDFLETLSQLIWYMDYPEVGPGIYPQYHVCRLASEQVKVILGGQGGDEVFTGYPLFIEVELEDVIAHENNPIRKIREVLQYLSFERRHKRFRVGLKRLSSLLFQRQHELGLVARFYHDRLVHSEQELASLFTEDFASSIGDYSTRQLFTMVLSGCQSASFMDRAQYYFIKTYLAGLLHVEDRTSMAVSIESRVPLCCDHRLLEFAASIKPSQRARGLRLKHVLREAVQDVVPLEIYRRTDKKGFPTPFDKWLLEQISDVRNILLSDRALGRGVFSSSYARKILDEFENGSRSRSVTVFMLLCVEFWFRNFVDKVMVGEHGVPSLQANRLADRGTAAK